MAEGAAAARANAAIDAATAVGTWIQLHTAAPGASGTANVASNNTRKQATFAAASGGSATTTADLDWTSVPAGEDYTHYSQWSASTSGTFVWSGVITANPVTTGDNFKIATGNLTNSITIAS